MASSSFKSTTKRISSSSEDSVDTTSRSLRRSRSLSRFSRPICSENTAELSIPEYIRTGPSRKFVNTARGSSAFPEISLDDLALEFFGSSSRDDNESSQGVTEGKEREGRSIRRWASDTASSRRKVRSVSRSRAGDYPSNCSTLEPKKSISFSDAGSRRRRSLSLARHRISDSESEIDNFQRSTNQSSSKSSAVGNGQIPLGSKASLSNLRRLAKLRSHENISASLNDYSSYSSALTDDESRDFGISGMEKIFRTVHAQNKAELPTKYVTTVGLYEAMRNELRHAVHEIQTELKQERGRKEASLAEDKHSWSNNSETLQDFSSVRNSYIRKFEQLEKQRQDLLTKMLLEEQALHDTYEIAEESPQGEIFAVKENSSNTRKRSCDRNQMSKQLTEEAKRYFEGFISNVDTDISSLDGERSDGSLTVGRKQRDVSQRRNEAQWTPTASASCPLETDGVHFPWLRWETVHDASLGQVTLTPVTPKTLYRDWDKDIVSQNDSSNNSLGSQGSCSPGFHSGADKIVATSKTGQTGNHNDTEEYLKLPSIEEHLFEMYMLRKRIDSGGLLLCTGIGIL